MSGVVHRTAPQPGSPGQEATHGYPYIATHDYNYDINPNTMYLDIPNLTQDAMYTLIQLLKLGTLRGHELQERW